MANMGSSGKKKAPMPPKPPAGKKVTGGGMDAQGLGSMKLKPPKLGKRRGY
jgi:hypothetical protein